MKGVRLIIGEKEDTIIIKVEQHLKKKYETYEWVPIKHITIKKIINEKIIGGEIVDIKPFNIKIKEDYLA
ncbi:MAG: hypothetical protein KKG75_04330 [Nanoarchaeota archaeon]|nr:hypothetical protein [Nanoarchaeota archaeon]